MTYSSASPANSWWKSDMPKVEIPRGLIVLSTSLDLDSRFQKTNTEFEAKALAFFSYDPQSKSISFDDTKNLQFMNIPKQLKDERTGKYKFNLFKGWENYKPIVIPRSIPHLANTLSAIIQYVTNTNGDVKEERNKDKTPVDELSYLMGGLSVKKKTQKEIVDSIDFITNKGVLKSIANMSNYSFRKYGDLEFNVVTLGNTIFLSNENYREIKSAQTIKFGWLGHKFESLITSGEPNAELTDEERDSRALYTNEETFKVLVNLTLAPSDTTIKPKFQVYMTSEMDCAIGVNDDPLDLSNYCEIKTHEINNTYNIHKKLFQVYLQGNLSGQKEFIVGFRDASGNLVELTRESSSSIEKTLSSSQKFDIQKARDFLYYTLEWIKSKVEFGGEGKVAYRVVFKNGKFFLYKVENGELVKKLTNLVYTPEYEAFVKKL